jgi:Spy/CpxP family protein refolding chaperone
MLTVKPVKGYLDLIELNQEQRKKVEEIRKDFLPRVERIRWELRQKRLYLNDLIFAPNPDMKAVENITLDISNLQAKLEREVINHILQEKEILTPEQKKQFCEIIKEEFEKGGLGVHGEKRQ